MQKSAMLCRFERIGGRNLDAQWPCTTKEFCISLRIAPFRTGIYGIAWVNAGVNRRALGFPVSATPRDGAPRQKIHELSEKRLANVHRRLLGYLPGNVRSRSNRRQRKSAGKPRKIGNAMGRQPSCRVRLNGSASVIPEPDYPDVSASRRSRENIGEFRLHRHGRAMSSGFDPRVDPAIQLTH